MVSYECIPHCSHGNCQVGGMATIFFIPLPRCDTYKRRSPRASTSNPLTHHNVHSASEQGKMNTYLLLRHDQSIHWCSTQPRAPDSFPHNGPGYSDSSPTNAELGLPYFHHNQPNVSYTSSHGPSVAQDSDSSPAINSAEGNSGYRQSQLILTPNKNQQCGQKSRKRGPFKDPDLREQTARTRKIGSCIRCRMQRKRVSL